MTGGETGGEALRAALVAHLAQRTRLFDAPPLRASLPQAVLEEPALSAADGAGVSGRVGTIAVACTDDGERPVRLRALVAMIEAAMEAVPPDLGSGWRLVALRLVRSRLVRAKGDRWVATSEFAVRMYRVN